MFKHLKDFSYKRTGLQAVGFYLAWGALTLVVVGVLGFLFGLMLISSQESTSQIATTGAHIGTFLAFVTTLVIACKIAVAKKNVRETKTIVLIILTGVLSILGGALLGFIIPAYLTTLPVHSHE